MWKLKLSTLHSCEAYQISTPSIFVFSILSIDWLPETVKLKQVNAISIDTFELFSYSNDEG